MILLKCDKCGKEYRFPDGMKAEVLAGGLHAALQGGRDCKGRLVGDVPVRSATIDFRALVQKADLDSWSEEPPTLGG